MTLCNILLQYIDTSEKPPHSRFFIAIFKFCAVLGVTETQLLLCFSFLKHRQSVAPLTLTAGCSRVPPYHKTVALDNRAEAIRRLIATFSSGFSCDTPAAVKAAGNLFILSDIT